MAKLRMVKRESSEDKRIRFAAVCVFAAALFVCGQLFNLQVLKYDHYTALATDTREIYKQLSPTRGQIYLQDSRAGQEYPAAINRSYYSVYVVPRDIPQGHIASTTDFLAELFEFDEERKNKLFEQLSKENDPYEPVAAKIVEEKIEIIKEKKIQGVGYVSQDYRFYPEGVSGAHILGFVGRDENNKALGHYGVEGAWEKELSGQSGFLAGEKNALGGLIFSAGTTLKKAEDGADLLLTIDRAVQYKSCDFLKKGFEEYEARNASLILLDVKTGAVLSMCSLPDFDPNDYGKVESVADYNNSAIFTPYEPGSVFKPIVMSMALDLGLVEPNTSFDDPGFREIDDFTIHNALEKKYGRVTMTQVLENSINTGMIWVEEKMSRADLKNYTEKFGFGRETGIGLDTEMPGDISSFDKKADIYAANASFGQGFTATPLQVAVAYAALANDGKLLRPYIVKEVRYPDGRKETASPKVVANVISSRAQKLITGMLISVVENTYKNSARLPDYYIAGKTGTAQIAERGGYSEESNHTFVGYFPANDAKFVLLVKYEAPQRDWAESTAAPVFKQVADFVLDYYGIKEDR